ncbi:MAG: ribbon-helix-helix protein, CopG family [Dehalococcoidia bacterium]
MKRITISLPDELNDALCAEAHRRGLSLSQVVREKVESELEKRRNRLPGFVGLADKRLPYSAEDIDEELSKTFGRD